MAYSVALLVHLLLAMALFGTSLATDRLLSAARREPASAGLALARAKLVPVETLAAVGAAILGFTLIAVHPAGMGLMKSGLWIHLKLTGGLLGVLLLGVSRVGIRADGVARWVQPVRGLGQLGMLLAVLAVTVLRQSGL